MPIKPENFSRYPGGSPHSPEWLAIRNRILERATCREKQPDGVKENPKEKPVPRCERCNLPHRDQVFRCDDLDLNDGSPIKGWIGYVSHAYHDPDDGENLGAMPMDEWPEGRMIKGVLTIAHFDQDPDNNADDNLFAWCQRCHLLHDAEQHAENARKTRRDKLAAGDLFDAD